MIWAFMKKSFRDYHLHKILDAFDLSKTPLDRHLSNYFRSNRAIGSKDRRVIAEKIYSLFRWQALVDHFCEGSNDWESRCKTLSQINLKKLSTDDRIQPHIRVSFPKCLFSRLETHYGLDKAISLCLASNEVAPTTIRTNVLKTTRQHLFQTWKEKYAVSYTKNSVFGIRFDEKINFGCLDEFKQGFFEIQDEASQLVANLAEPSPGDQVLDYCGGAGGKTLAFAHKLQGKGQLYIHDIRERPLIEAKRRLKRAGIENAQILQKGSLQLEKIKGKCNWVFVDVPCTGTGTLRRNPDLKWKFSDELLTRLVQEQRDIFADAYTYLAPHGKIVYATCSVLPEENDGQLAFFEQKYSLCLSGKPFRSFPTEGGMDGFFGAVLTQGS